MLQVGGRARAYNICMLYACTDEGLLLVCFVDGECTRGYGKEGRGGEKESGRESEREYWERCYLLEMK